MIRLKGIMLPVAMLLAFVTCSSSGKQDEDAAQQEQWEITINGKVLNPGTGTIEIAEITEGGTLNGWKDTVTLRSDNTFSKTVKLSAPGYYRMNFFNAQAINLILYKSDLDVTVDGSDARGASEIKGSPELDFIMEATNLLQGFHQSPEAVAVNQKFEKARLAGDREALMQAQQEYMDLYADVQKRVAAMIREQPASLGVVNFLQSQTIDRDRFYDTYLLVADEVKKAWPDTWHAREFVEMVEGMKTTAIGQTAPEIALPNPDGEIVKLSSLRGNYVLVDFWAKWCGPCRAENPNIVRVYNKYKDQGFTVFGVSLDRNREDWLQAIQDDNLTWTHVSDLKYWQSEAAKTYNITAIPFSILLDPNGVIIDKNLRGAALERKMAEIFAEK
ncbi:MAG TPA: TlpA disulfide reductase family protein [Cyclobacteriaceae bacterium]|nr:TlpA disulfide reductase family protein [Cyclobacteriaceae bacterium]